MASTIEEPKATKKRFYTQGARMQRHTKLVLFFLLLFTLHANGLCDARYERGRHTYPSLAKSSSFAFLPSNVGPFSPSLSSVSFLSTSMFVPFHFSTSLASSFSVPSAPSTPPDLSRKGALTMVGAGPGDPDLLTVSAFRVISDPGALVISDRLVSKEILELIKGEVRVANKHPGCADLAQDEIYSWCLSGLLEGKHVVRLKIGDPFVFGRGGEEVLRFREMGVEPKVIPGVSAVFAAPLLGNIPVTHRGVANQVVMCTGYGRNGTSPDLIRYHEEQTVVFLMAVGRLRELAKKLVSMAAYPPSTLVAIVEQAGNPGQRTVRGTLADIADVAEREGVKPPSTIIVGSVVDVL